MDKKILLFSKIKENAKIPSKREEDGGYDIYACFDEDFISIPPHEVKIIPTGIASCFDPEFVAILKERGSTGTKNMAIRAGVFDSGYRGEWLVPITNLNDNWLFITKLSKEETLNKVSKKIGEKSFLDKKEENGIFYPYNKAICQFVLLPIPKVEVKEVKYEELESFKSERGNGKLGSSGK